MPPDPPSLFTFKRMQWPYQSKIVGAGPAQQNHKTKRAYSPMGMSPHHVSI